MTLLLAVLLVVLAVVFLAWGTYDAGYGDGWMDHSEGRADVRQLWKRNP